MPPRQREALQIFVHSQGYIALPVPTNYSVSIGIIAVAAIRVKHILVLKIIFLALMASLRSRSQLALENVLSAINSESFNETQSGHDSGL